MSLRWRRRSKPAAIKKPAVAVEETCAIAIIACTLREARVEDMVCQPVKVPVDTAAELASEWLGGPYVTASSRAANVSWVGMMQPVFILEHDVVIQALIVEEAWDAAYELQEMLQDGRWKPAPGIERFRLQRHELLPMVFSQDL
jgi:hypothetical protein